MEIKRDIIESFKLWKDASDRKPILLRGARQIGKTWAMETFGKTCFDHCVKFDFDRQPELKSVFQITKSPQRLLKELELYCDQPIIAGRTLIIFDEIQECEEALNSLKYFCEDAPEYHVIAAGSLLGVAVKKRKMTVPVGKVKNMRMFPVSFKEFLRASDAQTYAYIDSLTEIRHLPEIILNKLRTEYRRYQVSGGMPEAIVAWLDNKGVGAVESILQDILDLYELDFAKYAESREIPRIRAIWHSLPAQLSKENRKFIYKVVKTGARSKDYEDGKDITVTRITFIDDTDINKTNDVDVVDSTEHPAALIHYKETIEKVEWADHCSPADEINNKIDLTFTDRIRNMTSELACEIANEIFIQNGMSDIVADRDDSWYEVQELMFTAILYGVATRMPEQIII